MVIIKTVLINDALFLLITHFWPCYTKHKEMEF